MKQKKLQKGTIIEVYWHDTLTVPSWTNFDEIDNARPPLVKTVGYYFGKHKEGKKIEWIIVNHSLHDSDAQGDYTIIPYGAIQQILRIE